MRIEQGANAKNAPATGRFCLVEDAAANLFVEPVVASSEALKAGLPFEEGLEHGARLPLRVGLPFVEALQSLDDETCHRHESEAVALSVLCGRLEVALLKSLDQEPAAWRPVGGPEVSRGF